MKHYKQLIAAMVLTMTASSAQALETVIDFENQTVFTPNIPSLTIDNVTFTTEMTPIKGGLSITDLDITNVGVTELDYSGQYLFNGALGFNELNISFLNPVSQFAFNLGDNQLDWEINAFDSNNISIGSLTIDALPVKGTNNGSFFGLSTVNPTGISYATLTQVGTPLFGADTIEFDNLKYTEVSPVPEPSTYALMLGGLGMVGFIAYRRRKTENA